VKSCSLDWKKLLRFGFGAVPSPRGAYPPKQSSKAPNWSMAHDKSVEFLSIFRMSSPPAQTQSSRNNAMPSYLKLSGDGSGLGFSVDVVRVRVCFAFFGFSFMTSSLRQWSEIVARIFLDSRLQYESLEPWIEFLAFLVPKLWPKDPKSCRNSLGQWFSKWSISTPRAQLDHPRGL